MAGTVPDFWETVANKTDQTDKPFPPPWSLGGATSEKHTKSVTWPGKAAGAAGRRRSRGTGAWGGQPSRHSKGNKGEKEVRGKEPAVWANFPPWDPPVDPGGSKDTRKASGPGQTECGYRTETGPQWHKVKQGR